MPKTMETNWKTVIGLLLMGALLALPAGFILSLILAGEPHEFLKPVYLERPIPIELHAVAGVAFWLARGRKFTQHKAWMMRGVGITYGAATTAIVAIPVFLTIGEYGGLANELDRWGGLLANVIFVEWLIRRKSQPQRSAAKNVYIGIQ